MPSDEEPQYRLEVVAQILDIHPNTIRRYERQGLVSSTQRTRVRLYSERAVLRLKRIVSATGLGVNLAEAQVVCNLLERLEDKDRELQGLREQLRRLLED